MPEYIFCLPFYPTSGKKSRSCERFSCAVIVKIVVAQWGWPITHPLSGLFTKISFFPSIRLVDGRPSVIYRLARKSWWSYLILSIKRPPLSPRPRIKSLIIAARWIEVCFPSVSSWKAGKPDRIWGTQGSPYFWIGRTARANKKKVDWHWLMDGRDEIPNEKEDAKNGIRQ